MESVTDGMERPDFFILRTVSSISSSSTSLFSQWLFVPLLGRVIYVYCAHIESKALIDKTSGLCSRSMCSITIQGTGLQAHSGFGDTRDGGGYIH